MPLYRGSRRLILLSRARPLVGPPTLTFIAGNSSTSYSDPTYTFASVNIGTASATRRVIIVFGFQAQYGAITGSNVKINGVTATIHSNAWSGSGGDPGIVIASAVVASGTTVAVTIAENATAFVSPNLAAYTVDDSTLVSSTPSVGTNFNSSAVNTITTASFTNSAGGFCVGAVSGGTGGDGTSLTGYTADFAFSSGGYGSLSTIIPGSATASSTWGGAAQSAAIGVSSWR